MKKTLLIIEDCPSICEMLKMLFSDDYDILTADSVEATFDVLNFPIKIDLVLIDYLLKDGTVESLVDILRARDVPYIMMTAWTPHQIKNMFFDTQLFLKKPFDVDVLINKVNNILSDEA